MDADIGFGAADEQLLESSDGRHVYLLGHALSVFRAARY
jgi:hypothetical protein